MTAQPLMKPSLKSLLLIACLMLGASMFNSCEWDTSPEPEHPSYITYTISAASIEFNGPDQLLTDIKDWIKEYQDVYDKEVYYSTGEASEFSKTDAEAVKKYEAFLPKFKSFIDECKNRLASGKYGELETPVKARFSVFAKRTQGQDGNLRYDEVSLTHP